MNFLIADTFTASLARLNGEEQKAAKITAIDLQIDPASPGHSLHKLDKAKDKRFWSVRVGSDLRLIVHRSDKSFLLCYVDHHDKAYAWAERRKLETHPTTGAAQFVEIRERVQEIVVPVHVAEPIAPARSRPPLTGVSEQQLLSYGVPSEWIGDLLTAEHDDRLLALAEHLPAEAGEAVIALATGREPPTPRSLEVPAFAPRSTTPPLPVDPFEHPDALRRFSRIEDGEELKRALEYPWDRWTVFLHPAQRELVTKWFGGPARVAGTAGTGKTVVAVHRAVHLARTNPDARVLLTTFSDPLAHALRTMISRLIRTEPRLRERIDVDSLDTVAMRLHERMIGPVSLPTSSVLRDVIRDSSRGLMEGKYAMPFLLAEWSDVVDAWQLTSWDGYRDVARLGRRTRLAENRRQELWTVFDRVRRVLADQNLQTRADAYSQLAARITAGERSPYDFIVVDEAQDLSVPQLRFLAALGGGRPDGLFFTGDLGQRIFQLPFSWRSLGVEVRGRSAILRINYRTSQQIRLRADRLLAPEVGDVDGNVEDRRGAVSVLAGAAPSVLVLDDIDAERGAVGAWLKQVVADGVGPGEIGVFVRSEAQLDRARSALDGAGLRFTILDERVRTERDRVSVATMHLTKGLEFRAVAVIACDDEVLPLQTRIEGVADEGDLEDTYETERHLLYVACTRARDHLLVTGVKPGSEFLEDLGS